MQHWYIGKPNELLCDLDDKVGSNKRLRIAQGRLRGAMSLSREGRGLSVIDYYIYRSMSAYHHHLMVHLSNDLPDLERCMWEQRLADDGMRGMLNLARLARSSYTDDNKVWVMGRSWSLLISPVYRQDYWRGPDYVCKCVGKHRAEVMVNCPVAAKLGNEVSLSLDYFGGPVYLNDPIRMGKQ